MFPFRGPTFSVLNARVGPFARSCFAFSLPGGIAARMRRQIQQEVLPHERGKIDRFRAAQFGMNRKRRDVDFVDKFFETGDTGQLDRLIERAVSPKRALSHPDVDLVLQRAGATDALGLQPWNQAIFLAFEMRSLGRNLFEMNFHKMTNDQ